MRTFLRASLVLALCVALVAACTGRSKDQDEALLGESGSGALPWANRIAFFDPAAVALKLMNPDGTGVLTVFTGEASDVVWSPDGRHIAFSSSKDADRTRAIYVVDVDGSPARQVTPPNRYDASPAWTMGGKRIVFSTSAAGRSEMNGIDVDGKNLTQLGPGDRPLASPDGTQVAFVSNRDGTRKVYVMAPDGTNVRALATGITLNASMSWSPDSRSMAIKCEEDLCIYSTGGASPKRVPTRIEFADYGPWSPDGQRIAVVSGAVILTVKVDGTAVTRVTNNNLINVSPSWSPDSKQVVFLSANQCGQCAEGALRYNGVHVANADGSSGGVEKTFVVAGSSPTWSPVGKK